jgi:hypothetical protein
VLRRYVAGHARLGEFIAEEAARTGHTGDTPAFVYISRTQNALLGRFAAAVEEEHNRERQQVARSPAQRRRELVCSLLAGEAPDETDASELRYRFDAWHIGVIATGVTAREVLESAKAEFQLLAVAHSDETTWAWLGGARKPTPENLRRAGIASRAGISFAVGEPGEGIDGWRQTHLQAQQALLVALMGPPNCVRYADIALLVPWLEDPVRGKALVDLYLAPLRSQKDGGKISRTALRAYLEAAKNVSAAARQLGIGRRTLAYRLETIEERLGYQLDSRVAELAVSLCLHDLLDGADRAERKESTTRISGLS